jgi:hypothetical protein
VICPRCGENNPDNYKFCGMCGNTLKSAAPLAEKTVAEKSTPKTPSQPAPTSAARSDSMAFSRMEPRGGTKPGTIIAEEPGTSRTAVLGQTDVAVEPIAGPSLLGLNQPTPDSIRETSFRGMTTYYPEERHPAWGRIFLTLIIIVGLVAVGWWRYKNYGLPGHGRPAWLSAMNKTSPPSDNQTPDYGSKPVDRNANQNADQNKNQGQDQNKAASGDTPSSTSQTGDSAASADQSSSNSEKTSDNNSTDNKSADSTSTKAASNNDQTDQSANVPAKPAKAATNDEASAPAAKFKPAAASSDSDGLFRKGEAYLYGRGAAENCTQAIRYLKSAADKSNAKARSTFGTMYATGHCVPRDLPTSYRWFAMALQADPNNSILEKDLSAIWNQMTPPERQLATKLKPNGE